MMDLDFCKEARFVPAIMEFCIDISNVTVERNLTELAKRGDTAKVGAGLSTGYVRI